MSRNLAQTKTSNSTIGVGEFGCNTEYSNKPPELTVEYMKQLQQRLDVTTWSNKELEYIAKVTLSATLEDEEYYHDW